MEKRVRGFLRMASFFVPAFIIACVSVDAYLIPLPDEAVVIILDVGSSMTTDRRSTDLLDAALKAVTLLVQQKIQMNKDEVGIVLFGTNETKNDLAQDGYEHIVVQREIGRPDLDLLREIENIRPGGFPGDFIDALIVSMDMLVKKTREMTYQKRVFLITDAGTPVNEDDLDTIINQFNKMDASLNVIGVDFEDDNDTRPSQSQRQDEQKYSVQRNNQKLLQKICDKVAENKGVLVPIRDAIDMLSIFSGKAVLQRTTYRGWLEVSSILKIPVWSFMKTKEVTAPSMEKISKLSLEAANPGDGEVVNQKTFHLLDDPDKELHSDELTKAYKYGKSLVPFAKFDEANLKWKADSCLKVIGFTERSRVPRHHYMTTVDCIVSLPSDESAAVALSALIHALAETNRVAIVRFVKRANSAPLLGVLTPHIKADWECLFFNKLPFSEDIRQYTFPSLLENAPDSRKAWVPTQEQLDAAEDIINSMDLMVAGTDDDGNPAEAFKPKHLHNPALQHFYNCVTSRALHPKDPLPKLNPLVERYINPDKSMLEKAAPVLKSFKEKFPLVKTEAKEKEGKARTWGDAFLNDNAGLKLDSYMGDESKKLKIKEKDGESFSLQSLLSGGVEEVGMINPVQDFKDMIRRKDVDLVDKAVGEIQKMIVKLVHDSIKDSHYQKALECLRALRDGCLQENEVEHYNRFMADIKKYFKGKRRNDFWLSIVTNRVSLITNEEHADSEFSADDARKFLDTDAMFEMLQSDMVDDEDHEAVQPAEEPQKDHEPDAESLFDMIE